MSFLPLMKKDALMRFLSVNNITLCLLAIALFLSGLAAAEPFVHLYGIAKLIEFSLLWILGVSTVRQHTALFYQVLPPALAIVVSFVALTALTQFFLQHSVDGLWYFFGERHFTSETPGIANASLDGRLVLRPYATFPHPNVLAMYLLVGSVVLALWLMKLLKRIRQSQFAMVQLSLGLLGYLLASSALLLTMSRVVILLWVVSVLLFLLILADRHAKRSSIGILGIFFLLLIGAGFSSLLLPRFSALFSLNQAVTDRVILSEAALGMFSEYFLTGVGLSHFLIRLPEYIPATFSLIQPVHNIFLLTGAELGIIGLSLLLYILGKGSLSILKTHPLPVRWVLIFLYTCLIVLGMTDHYFLTLQQGQMLFILIAASPFALSRD